jgi:hypothetical protein
MKDKTARQLLHSFLQATFFANLTFQPSGSIFQSILMAIIPDSPSGHSLRTDSQFKSGRNVAMNHTASLFQALKLLVIACLLVSSQLNNPAVTP